MGRPSIVEWFDNNWMRQRDRAKRNGLESLSKPNQVLVVAGFLLDSCVGDGIWAIVDGVVEGQDEGLTGHMPAAFEEIGLPEVAGHVREIIRLRTSSGAPESRDRAIGHWSAIETLFGQWVPGGERVLLTRLYEWYHEQAPP